MGRFHALHVRQKTIYKQNTRRGYQKWVIDEKTIAPRSSDAAVEKKHYNRNMRISKMFCALVQYRVEELTNDYNDTDMVLKSLFLNLRREPTAENLNSVLSNNEFQNLFRKISKTLYGSESKMLSVFYEISQLF